LVVVTLSKKKKKVIIGVRAVLANGGLLAHSGAFLIAMAAKAHHVPLVVLSGLYKFTPLYPSEDQDTFADMGPPEQVLAFDEADAGDCDVTVKNPLYDYVPPSHVSLFISNQGERKKKKKKRQVFVSLLEKRWHHASVHLSDPGRVLSSRGPARVTRAFELESKLIKRKRRACCRFLFFSPHEPFSCACLSKADSNGPLGW
jgi:hypothetical protein